MFVFLALVFGVGFVVFGVGTGGGGITDIFNNIGGGGGGTSLSKAKDHVAKHPNDPQAYRELATAYESSKRPNDAIGALETYTRMRPKDTDALGELAGLYSTQARNLESQRSAIATANSDLYANQAFGPDPTSPLGKALGSDPLTSAATTKVNAQLQALATREQTALGNAISAYKRLASARPSDANVQGNLAVAATNASDYKTAIAAWKRYLKLAPGTTNADQIRQEIKRLRALAALQPALGGSTSR
jgi:cytochrome c-type biogenesis protein CcmH/NrfG